MSNRLKLIGVRKSLGLSQDELRQGLGMQSKNSQRIIARWEQGSQEPRQWSELLGQLSDWAQKMHQLSAALVAEGLETKQLTAFETNEAFWQAHPAYEGLPVSFYQAATGRAAAQLLADHGLDIDFRGGSDSGD